MNYTNIEDFKSEFFSDKEGPKLYNEYEMLVQVRESYRDPSQDPQKSIATTEVYRMTEK